MKRETDLALEWRETDKEMKEQRDKRALEERETEKKIWLLQELI